MVVVEVSSSFGSRSGGAGVFCVCGCVYELLGVRG